MTGSLNRWLSCMRHILTPPIPLASCCTIEERELVEREMDNILTSSSTVSKLCSWFWKRVQGMFLILLQYNVLKSNRILEKAAAFISHVYFLLHCGIVFFAHPSTSQCPKEVTWHPREHKRVKGLTQGPNSGSLPTLALEPLTTDISVSIYNC